MPFGHPAFEIIQAFLGFGFGELACTGQNAKEVGVDLGVAELVAVESEELDQLLNSLVCVVELGQTEGDVAPLLRVVLNLEAMAQLLHKTFCLPVALNELQQELEDFSECGLSDSRVTGQTAEEPVSAERQLTTLNHTPDGVGQYVVHRVLTLVGQLMKK